jgi:hypothetical protein
LLAQLLQPATGGGRGRRAPLYWWLYARAEEIRPLLASIRPSWDNFATVLPDINEVRDGSGKRPSGARVRKTWFEVCQAKGWVPKPIVTSPKSARASPSPPASGLPTPTMDRQAGVNPPEMAPGVRALPAEPAASPSHTGEHAGLEEGTVAPAPEFQVARLPTVSGSAPSRATPLHPAPVQQRRDPDVEIARLLARSRLGSIPMPAVPEPEDDQTWQ